MKRLKIYDMELHGIIILNDYDRILRVPGGWIYAFTDDNGYSTVFVPFHDEFDAKECEF